MKFMLQNRVPLTLFLAGLFISPLAAAQEPSQAETALSEPGEVKETVSHPAPAHLQQENSIQDPDAVFRSYNVFAEGQRTMRLVGAGGGVVFGAATMGIGSYVAGKTDTSKTPWLVVGGVMSGLSLLGMFFPGEAERLADRHSSGTSGHTDAEALALMNDWRELADSARTERYAGSAIGMLLGAGSLTTGIAFAAGAGNLSRNQQATWGGLLMGSGVMLLSSSTFNFFMQSDTEAAYQGFMEGRPQQKNRSDVAINLELAPAPSGLLLGASGSF